MSPAVVEQENIGLTVFFESSIKEHQAIGERRWDDGLAADQPKLHLPAVTNVIGAIVGNVEIERAVPVHVRESDRHASEGTAGAGFAGDLVEMAMAVVRPAADANAVAADQKIERAVAGDIREDNATANHVGDVNAGFG